MKRIRFTAEAELDVDEAHLWYHRREPPRGREFLAAVHTCIASIQRYPEAYALVDATMRRALIRRFPYVIFYEIEPDDILVFGVFHAARDPHAWRRRRDG